MVMFCNMYNTVFLASINACIHHCATIIVITDVIIQNHLMDGVY